MHDMVNKISNTMREIKFRGRCSAESEYAGEWRKGNGVSIEEGLLVDFTERISFTYHVDSDTIGQYIGRKDCTGEEIYEGDILIVVDSVDGEYLGCIGIVEWSEEDDCKFILRFDRDDLLLGIEITPSINVRIIGDKFSKYVKYVDGYPFKK